MTRVEEEQPYPDHHDRFEGYNYQVLCKKCLTGRCYWEAEWSGKEVYLSVAYKGISRKGDGCGLIYNEKSWSVNYTGDQ